MTSQYNAPAQAGKTVIITGITGGIGSALAQKFASEGFNIGGSYFSNTEAAAALKVKLEKFNVSAEIYKCDISNHSEVRDFISKFSSISCLINNAGITAPALTLKMAESDFTNVLDVNVNGAFFVTKESAKIMTRQKHGSIINISSILSASSPAGAANYSASKAALNSLTKTFSRELGRFNITVNAVFPGFHNTAMGSAVSEKYIESIKNESVLGKTTDINELVNFVYFLSGLKTVSGQIFNIDSRIV